MKSRITILCAIAAPVLLLVGCGAALGSNGAADRATSGASTSKAIISISGINPSMAAQFAAASSNRASRAFLFATTVNIYVYDSSGSYVTSESFDISQNGPGGLNGEVSIPLTAGSTYNLNALVKNQNEVDNNASYQAYGNATVTMSSSGDTWTSITMRPYYPYEATPAGTSSTILASVYDKANKVFTTIGGEKWFYQNPSGKAVRYHIVPPDGTVVYATLCDSYGNTLTGELSPSFTDPNQTNRVTIEAGATAGYLNYIGVIVVASASTDQTVTVYAETPSLADDNDEDNDYADQNASLSLLLDTTTTGLISNDWDYFHIAPTTTGRFCTYITTPTAAFKVDWKLYNGNGYLIGSGQQSTTLSDITVTTTQSLTAGLGYSIGYRLTRYGATGFEILGGDYTVYPYVAQVAK
jgi:hypothetical protein